jgi:hypothetical protein
MPTAAPAQNTPGLSLEGITIIDGNGGAPTAGTLTIQGNRIGAVETQTQAASPGAHCINAQAEYYPYAGGVCEAGYQLGTHNCRTPDGDLHLIPPADCRTMGGLVALPAPAGAFIRNAPGTAPRN